MFFRMISSWNEVPPGAQDAAFLLIDYWDDWFSFRTMFSLWVFDEVGGRHSIGSVKIGQQGLLPHPANPTPPPGHRFPALPDSFDALGADFFSLGQDENYYETLNKLTEIQKSKILFGLRDCAYDLQLFDAEVAEPVMQKSLLRTVDENNVRGRLHRLSTGDATLTKYEFDYVFPGTTDDIVPPVLGFTVIPESEPPTNVHVLIGRNGVGKTRCMRGIAEALLGRERDDDPPGRIVTIASADAAWSFSGLVMISFSAFDDIDLRPIPADFIRSQQVGLLKWLADETGGETPSMKSPIELAVDFKESFKKCRYGLRATRWRAAVQTLESDDLFAEADVTSLLDLDDESWESAALALYKRLSSGHAIVLLTMTRLVEMVDERTLVLLDEPEGHLHPPLLSAFIRALSDLLIKRNGVAIIATHSPVVLQEVPRSCAWKIRRARRVAIAERPAVETFGENIGILTREVFGYEITKAGFHRLLNDAVHVQRLNYNGVIERFGGQLGAEARSIVQALVSERDAS